MKKIFAFLLLGLTVAFASCGDEKTETGTDWFLTPVAEVNGTTVGLSCQTRFGEGVLENTSVGFSYAAVVDNKIGAFADVAGSAVDGTGVAATLTGLQPETSYVVFAYAGLSTGRVQSAGAVFKTGQDDMPDPDPERPAFGTPAASGVTKTEATLSCTFNFEDTADYDVYFRYKPASSGSYDRVNVPTGTGTKTAALTGLTPGTTYEFALCADWDGQTYTSAAATFTTSSEIRVRPSIRAGPNWFRRTSRTATIIMLITFARTIRRPVRRRVISRPVTANRTAARSGWLPHYMTAIQAM